MSEKIKLPSNKSFGLLFSFIFFFISFYPIFTHGNLRYWSLIIAFIFLILGLSNSKILTPMNKYWMKLGFFLGLIISPIVMGAIFFLIVTPTGIIMNFLKKDLLHLKFNNKKSYWILKKGPKSDMKKQF